MLTQNTHIYIESLVKYVVSVIDYNISFNDEGIAIYGNLENKINTLYWPVEHSIPKNNDRSRL
jgi:hypothetical protein